jgi:hypothetical protein
MTAYGGPDVMSYQDMPDPMPGAGDVLVRVAGIGINPEDMLERNGDLKDRYPLNFPAIIGLDVSGTVIATGDGVTDLKPGDRVCGWSYHTYAELVADKAAFFAMVPETMELVDAAAIPLVGVTGSQLMTVAGGLQSGQTVLISGAAGAVGRCAVYMAKASGGRDRGGAAFSTRPGGQHRRARNDRARRSGRLRDDSASRHRSEHASRTNRNRSARKGQARRNVRIGDGRARRRQRLPARARRGRSSRSKIARLSPSSPTP